MEPEKDEIPPDFTRRVLKGHTGSVWGCAVDPQGRWIVSASSDATLRVWDAETGALLRVLEGHTNWVWSCAVDPQGRWIVSASDDKTLRVWDATTGAVLRVLEGHTSRVHGCAVDPQGRWIVSASSDNTLRVWDAQTGALLRVLEGHTDWVRGCAVDPQGRWIVSASDDETLRVWDATTGAVLRVFEGHTGVVYGCAVDPQGRWIVSASYDQTLRVWDAETGALLRVLEGHTDWVNGCAVDPQGRWIVSASTDDTLRVWDVEAILGAEPAIESVQHTTAKIVLVGDSGVGKTGLGWRLAHDAFKEHSSTHGQQFWVLDQLKEKRKDGTECEAVLWDLAGQPDYRLIHGLFLDDADLALVLFDPTEREDPFSGVDFWLKALAHRGKEPREEDTAASNGADALPCRTILVGARIDRGIATLPQRELDRFCEERGITGGYVPTSALTKEGIEDLIAGMKQQVNWEAMAATTTTATFKRIKEYVLGLKEKDEQTDVLTHWQHLREQLEALDENWDFTDAEMRTAVGHLAKYGYVRVLRTVDGEERVLLVPELLNNLAASFVLEARRNPKGLGALDEKGLSGTVYPFPELTDLNAEERGILLDAATVLFLGRNVCLRESIGAQTLLIFPELINLRKPYEEQEGETEEDVAYTISGAVENVYAALVVLLGYTNIFTRTQQWKHEARYEMSENQICGFRQIGEGKGELEFVLYYGKEVVPSDRLTYRGLFERILESRDVTVERYPPLRCEQGHLQAREDVSRKLRRGKRVIFCEECEERVEIPDTGEPITLSAEKHALVEKERAIAARRTDFEAALTRIKGYVRYLHGEAPPPTCFISYAWGHPDQERWVATSLVDDLLKAGINVILDRRDNAEPGKSIARFIELIPDCDWVIVVGTPLYFKKYKNKVSESGSIVAAEVDLIHLRLTGTEEDKQSVLPVLLEGEDKASFPSLLQGRTYADFRDELDYFATLFDLILTLYRIPLIDPALTEIRKTIHARGLVAARME